MPEPHRFTVLQLALLAGLGGAVGTGVRAVLTTLLFPGAEILTVFVINTVGSFVLGALVSRVSRRVGVFLGTGVLGGFTTYSALSLATVELTTSGAPMSALFLAAGTIIAGCIAALLGLRVADSIRQRSGVQGESTSP